MTQILIPELNQRLEDLRAGFLSSSETFTRHVKVSTERFTEEDRMDFDAILAEIREFALSKITEFISSRITTKSTTFDEHFSNFGVNVEDLTGQLDNFRQGLEEASRKLKQQETEGQDLLERITDKYAKTEMVKKVMRAFKENAQESMEGKKADNRMTRLYQTKLAQKCFFPWRALTYKDGYQNSVRRQSQVQLRKIHIQFGSIVEMLKQKIMETEELIRTKRAAKGEFAYALSKNLLKTISNLSLEVMSLNQVAAKDKDSEEQTQHFLNQVNKVIKERLQIYRQTMYQLSPAVGIQKEQEQGPKEVPNRILSPKTKGKRISFA